MRQKHCEGTAAERAEGAAGEVQVSHSHSTPAVKMLTMTSTSEDISAFFRPVKIGDGFPN